MVYSVFHKWFFFVVTFFVGLIAIKWLILQTSYICFGCTNFVFQKKSLLSILYMFSCSFVKMQVGVFWNLLIYSIWKNEQQNIYIYQYWGLKKVLYLVETYLERVNQWIVQNFVEFIIIQWLILLALRPSFGEHAKFLAVCATFVIPTSDRCKQQGEAGSWTEKKSLQEWLLLI